MAGENDEIEKTDEAPAAAKAKAGNPWLAVVAVILLVPGISFALTQYVLIPRITASVNDSHENVASPEEGKSKSEKSGKSEKSEKSEKGGKGGEKGGGKGMFSYEFPAIVVNLAGTMGTRYIKVNFTVFSSNADLQVIMTENKAQLMDVALGVLSSRTMADLELAGAKNVIRNDLSANFNQALNSEVVNQIYFSEFVVQ